MRLGRSALGKLPSGYPGTLCIFLPNTKLYKLYTVEVGKH